MRALVEKLSLGAEGDPGGSGTTCLDLALGRIALHPSPVHWLTQMPLLEWPVQHSGAGQRQLGLPVLCTVTQELLCRRLFSGREVASSGVAADQATWLCWGLWTAGQSAVSFLPGKLSCWSLEPGALSCAHCPPLCNGPGSLLSAALAVPTEMFLQQTLLGPSYNTVCLQPGGAKRCQGKFRLI